MITQSSSAAITVLVVEDDFLVRDCAAEALSEAGFAVLQAASAPEALLLLQTTPVDVVFTDVNMPGEFDGLGLARRVRRRWPDIGIVITSGRGWPEQDVEGAQFLPKPYMFDRLARTLNEVLSRRHEASPTTEPSAAATSLARPHVIPAGVRQRA